MNNIHLKNIALVAISVFFIMFTSTLIGQAKMVEDTTLGTMLDHEMAFTDTAGFNNSIELGHLTKIVIEAFLSLLGIIFIILIIIGGYGWMMAGGDEGKVTAAKERIRQAIIGLIITVSAYAITYFVFNALPWGG